MKVQFFPGILLLTLITVSISTVYADIQVESSYTMGDLIAITGTTNFNTDNSVLIEVWPASFGPKGKYEPSMAGGGSVVVPVQSGENLDYHWNGTFDSSGWAPDTYMVRAEIIGKNYVETRMFDLMEKSEVEKVLVAPEAQSEINQTEITPVHTPQMPEEIPTENIPESVPVPTQKSSLSGGTIALSLGILTMSLFMLASRR
ncbi:hypothetical protein [Methanospirillum hungatei]|uniref:hypothetical protein n=1 Tax=Methanospirillum hungatei TaxID=2203 RepID=UPI0026EA018C|nr:hypothetical protein [Methanospirillum hungatei]MCA1915656.1 hypothetical protein [Methanospirillum hungatei]